MANSASFNSHLLPWRQNQSRQITHGFSGRRSASTNVVGLRPKDQLRRMENSKPRPCGKDKSLRSEICSRLPCSTWFQTQEHGALPISAIRCPLALLGGGNKTT